jgi:hypothetical protein
MAIKSGASVDVKLLGIYLSPSWLSGLITLLTGIMILGGTVLLTHVGTSIQQSLLGLHDAYTQSSIGFSVDTISNKFAQNVALNNVLLFLMWGSVGLVVYSIVQGVANELKQADRLLRRLYDAPASRAGIIRNVISHIVIRLGALACWWALFRFTIYKLLPYAIGASHASALHLTNASGWWHSLLGAIALMLSVYVLTVLLRLVMLRPRLFSSEVIL